MTLWVKQTHDAEAAHATAGLILFLPKSAGLRFEEYSFCPSHSGESHQPIKRAQRGWARGGEGGGGGRWGEGLIRPDHRHSPPPASPVPTLFPEIPST